MSKKMSDEEFAKRFVSLLGETKAQNTNPTMSADQFGPVAEMAMAIYTAFNSVGFMPEQAFDLTASCLEIFLAKMVL